MGKYIDKDALVAEIERRLKVLYKDRDFNYLQIKELEALLSFIDTLEVKENDLVEELDFVDYISFFKEHPEYDNEVWGYEETWAFGQYCYKLGLKARKGE